MKSFLLLLTVAAALPAESGASILQCPRLTGRYFCKAVPGSHDDMIMIIGEERREAAMVYSYRYEQAGQAPYTLYFPASDQGEKNPKMDIIGRCWKRNFFNTKDGKLTEKTLLNRVNAKGDYEVVRHSDQSIYLRCERRK